MYWHGHYGIELKITKDQASIGSHQGQCDDDIASLMEAPAIKRQLAKITNEQLYKELREYGAWEDDELRDRENNLSRLLWLACGDIVEGNI